MTHIALIGAGNMGGALAHGWLKKGQSLTIADKNENTLNLLRQTYPAATVTTDNRQAVQNADIIVIAVKPWLMDSVLDEIRPVLDIDRQIIVSDAANYGTDKLSAKLGGGGQYFYVIPNIAAEYGQSMSFLSYNGQASSQSIQAVRQLYELCGEVMEVNESQIAAGMMMASCGIAYMMRMIRAMSEGGVELGFYPQQAQLIAMQTMQGAVELLRQSGLHPEVAIDKVTTPGGVTIKGLNELDRSGFNAAVVNCLKAGLK